MTFDLDLLPTDLNINRGHLLIQDYLPTKFEVSWAKRSWVISCTRLRDTDIPTNIPTYRPTDRHTDRHVQSNMPLLFQRGHKNIDGVPIIFMQLPTLYKNYDGENWSLARSGQMPVYVYVNLPVNSNLLLVIKLYFYFHNCSIIVKQTNTSRMAVHNQH